MTLTDNHQPKTAGAVTKPAVFVDGGSGTTGLGIAERLRLQNDVMTIFAWRPPTLKFNRVVNSAVEKS